MYATEIMNPDLQRLEPYPFQKLAALFREVQPNHDYRPISLSIGEPRHATPQFIKDALTANLDGLANYPTTAGSEALRCAIANWLAKRYDIPPPDAITQVLPVNGSREALFAFAQTVIDRSDNPVVVCPNPFYQIYEGAALLAGAAPHFLNTLPHDNHVLNFAQLPEEVWQRTQLIYVCSPGNPNGHVMSQEEWQKLFEMSDRYGFVIASDECYSEIYFGENKPLGALQAAFLLDRGDFRNLVVFSSLSKRSNVPGMRSGFVAGDAGLISKFALYRTYHGSAMNPAIQAASIAAWKDELHVAENRSLYVEKFTAVIEILKPVLPVVLPDAGFYLWVNLSATTFTDTTFAKALYRDYNVTSLPGSYLARTAHGINPGENFVRLALVANTEETVEAAKRIVKLVATS